jgi:phosphoribosyl-ATP pyrophosphohydrolase
MQHTLDALYQTILNRKNTASESSYVAKSFAKGPEHIAKKFGEEAVETVIAAIQNNREQIVYESADTLFHLLMLLAAHGITPDEVAAELKRREGTSGIAEKESRKNS